MPGHGAQLVATPRGIVVHCECGWRVDPMSSEERATNRWQIHVRERRAAAAMASAFRTCEDCSRRRRELAATRSAMRRRREALAERRRALERERMHVHSSAITAPRCTGETLVRALRMADRSVLDLWVGYFALGGTLGLQEVEEVLAGARRVGPPDHDLLAMALNEWFDDAGFGQPVELWDAATRARLH